jgi:hypothetical protein
MPLPKKYQDILKAKGVSLAALGLKEIALERDDALQAVGLLREAFVPILGGDVYQKRSTGIQPAYANWHSDSKPGETQDAYCSRSCSETENYIKKIPESSEAPPLFVLVTGN